MDWTVKEAEHKLDEIAGKALHEERQRIQTDQGVVVLISEEELKRIEGKKKSPGEPLLRTPKGDVEFPRHRDQPKISDEQARTSNPLIEYLKNGPGFEGVDISRDESPARDIK